MDAVAQESLTKGSNERFLLLDGLRGLAAICVMWFHFAGDAGHGWFEAVHGRLAVDFFFLLSGFVICGAYEKKLLNGVKLSHFAMTRAIRLVPMLWLCVIAEQILITWRSEVHHDQIDYSSIAIATMASLLAVPNFFATPQSYFVPLPARWSLFFEMLVNLVYAASIRHLTNRNLIAIIVLSAIALVLINPRWGINSDSLTLAGARASFSFFLGVLIYRLYISKRLLRINLPPPVIALIVLFVCFFPANTWFEVYFAAMSTFILLPIALIAACYVRLNEYSGRFAYILGEISYPVYLLHEPAQFALAPVMKKIGIAGNLASFLTMLATLLLGLLVVRWIDEPVRNWLSCKTKQLQSKKQITVQPT